MDGAPIEENQQDKKCVKIFQQLEEVYANDNDQVKKKHEWRFK